MTGFRPTWDEAWMNVAHVISERSLCVRDKVGAVVVSSANRIIDTGYNGPPATFIHDDNPCDNWCSRAKTTALVKDYTNCPSLHAEANALLFGDRTLRIGGTMYVTSGICGGCAKLIANSGIVRVVCDTTHNAPHRASTEWFEWLRLLNIQCDEMKH